MVWKKNGRIYIAKKALGNFESYIGDRAELNRSKTERTSDAAVNRDEQPRIRTDDNGTMLAVE